MTPVQKIASQTETPTAVSAQSAPAEAPAKAGQPAFVPPTAISWATKSEPAIDKILMLPAPQAAAPAPQEAPKLSWGARTRAKIAGAVKHAAKVVGAAILFPPSTAIGVIKHGTWAKRRMLAYTTGAVGTAVGLVVAATTWQMGLITLGAVWLGSAFSSATATEAGQALADGASDAASVANKLADENDATLEVVRETEEQR